MTLGCPCLFLTKGRSIHTDNAQWYNFTGLWETAKVWPDYRLAKARQEFLNDRR